MISETNVQRAAWLRVARTSTMWRLNVGVGWVSALGPAGITKRSDGSVLIRQARPMALGFALTDGSPVKGSADLIGRTTITITPEMVGKRIAVFTSLEAKNSKGGRVSTFQKNWRDQTADAGGIAGVFTSPEEAEEIISDWLRKIQQPTD
jgi:hypothetical protein